MNQAWRARRSSHLVVPNVVGLRPVRPRNALTRELNCCSSASMVVTVKIRLQGRQSVENVLSSYSVYRYLTERVACLVAPPAPRQTPS